MVFINDNKVNVLRKRKEKKYDKRNKDKIK